MTKPISQGYKQTKIGVIPEEWEMLTINQLVNIDYLYKPLDGNHGDIHPKSSDFMTSGIPFIMANNIKNGVLDLENCSFIAKNQADKLQKGFSIIGDVLLTHKGTVGNVVMVKNLDTDYIMLTPQVTYYRVKDHSQLNNHYIFQYFLSKTFQQKLEEIAGGGTRAYIGITEQRNLPFILPPLKEQEKIAEILSAWDDAITKQEQLIKQKQVFKKGIMQQIFSQQLRFMEFKENWKRLNVGSFMIERNKQIPKSDKYPLMAFVAYKGVTEKGDRYDREFLVTDEETKKYKQTEFGDFIYSSNNLETGSIGLNKYGAATISPVYSIFQITKSSDYMFISNLLVTKKFINNMVRYRQGVMYGQWRIHESDFLKIKVSIPCLEEQTKIANFLTIIDDELTKQTEFLDQLKLQKQSLMQKLLTGQVRTFNFSKEMA